jgi:hypothetical protein
VANYVAAALHLCRSSLSSVVVMVMVMMMVPGGKRGRSGCNDEEKCNNENLLHVPNPTTIFSLRGVPQWCGTKTANGEAHGTDHCPLVTTHPRSICLI